MAATVPLHTIAHRDRAAEVTTRRGDSPARPVSGLVSSRSRQLALSNRTFPHPSMQWSNRRFVVLTYRCGGSAGISESTSPASRFTRCVNIGHLTRCEL